MISPKSSIPQDSRCEHVTVVQGDYRISDDHNIVLSTILGSCVAVCLFDEVAMIGGMNHFLLPGREDDGNENVKYGTYAMEMLINQLIKNGADRYRLKAKLFGGGRMTANLSDIGASNIAFGQKFLSDEGIPCVSESVGGLRARRVQFVPTTGAARQRFVESTQVDEREVAPAAPKLPKQTDITLF